MTGSTFARGNARKLLYLPLYVLGALASAFVPRKRGLWVFGSGPGVGEGALELYHVARSADPTLQLVWLARDRKDLARAQSIGIPSTVKSSLRGFWLTLRAQVVVVTHGFGDANRFGSRGGFIVQLWHGIPLKLIQLDSPVTTRTAILPNSRLMRSALRLMYRRASTAISLMPAASEYSATRLRSAFGLPTERVVVTGDPRDDVLNRGRDLDRTAAARAILYRALDIKPTDDIRVLLYAPTWRDGASDPAIPTQAEWVQIAEHLQSTNSLLIIRPHPMGLGDYAKGPEASPRIRLLPSATVPDITPLLPAMDVLITDFSSVAFDFALTGRPILFLVMDEDDYVSTRGLYQPYHQFTGGTQVTSWTDLLGLLQLLKADRQTIEKLEQHSKNLASAVHAYTDGQNTDRVYAEIVRRLRTNR